MFQKSRIFSKGLCPKRVLAVLTILFSGGLLSACGQEPESRGRAVDISEIGTSLSGEDKTGVGAGDRADTFPAPEGNGSGVLPGAGTHTAASPDEPQMEEIRKQFGEDCIAGQTFEVELSEYSGKVWFVPYAPSAGNQDFRMHIVQNGEVLKEIAGYVPENLEGEKFGSLDAVSFFDVNYDDITDIVLIETYGSTTFAAVYYGNNDDYGSGPYFLSQDDLSENITSQVEPLTVPNIRSFLSDGKKNGEFSSYQEAYRAVGRLYEMEGSNERQYDLIYIDDDNIPELAAGVNGYFISLYTFSDGKVFTLMDGWGYGAMGNVGYEYVPGGNSLRNYNNDYAGAVLYTTFMTVDPQHRIDVSVEIVTYNFDDANGNGMPDENELDSMGKYSASYIDGKEISEEEYASYNQGEYVYIQGKMSIGELLEKLK